MGKTIVRGRAAQLIPCGDRGRSTRRSLASRRCLRARVEWLEARCLLAFDQGPVLVETFDDVNLTPAELLSPSGWDDNQSIPAPPDTGLPPTPTTRPLFHHQILGLNVDSAAALMTGGTTLFQGLPSQYLGLFGVVDTITFPDVNTSGESVFQVSVDTRRDGPATVTVIGTGGILVLTDPTPPGPGDPAGTWDTLIAQRDDIASNGSRLGLIRSIVVTAQGAAQIDNLRIAIAPNHAPVAAPDFTYTPPNTPIDIAVLANDADEDHDPLTIQSVTAGVTRNGTFVPSTGTVRVVGFQVRYTPAPNFHGEDSFSYTIADTLGATATADVVVEVNTPPVVTGNNYDLPHGATGALDVKAPGLIAFATDAENDPLTALAVVGQPTARGGSVTIHRDRSFSYTLPPGIIVDDTFSFGVNDGFNNSVDTGTIVIRVADLAPQAIPDTLLFDHVPAGTEIDGQVRGSDADVVNTPHGPVFDSLTYELVQNVHAGGLTLNPNGSFRYYPAAIQESFKFRVFDGALYGNVATVFLNVQDALPTALPPLTPIDARLNPAVPFDTANPRYDRSTLGLSVLEFVDDFDDRPRLTLRVLTGPGYGPYQGSILLRPDGTYLYTLTPNMHNEPVFYRGPDEFSFVANDGYVDSNVATLHLAVQSAPVALDDTYSVAHDSMLQIPAPGLLANDIDLLGGHADETPFETRVHVGVSSPTYGTVSIDDTGAFTYTPTPGFAGSDSFSYTLYQKHNGEFFGSDARLGGKVTIQVTSIPPLAVDDDYWIGRGQNVYTLPQVGGVLDNDRNNDTIPLTALQESFFPMSSPIVTDLVTVKVKFNDNGTFVTDAFPVDFTGIATLTYRALSGTTMGNEATVRIHVLPASDGDGIPDNVEDGAPNGGDGNHDGAPDRLQEYVASLPDIFGQYVTLADADSVGAAYGRLTEVRAEENPSPGDAPAGVTFPFGFFRFHIRYTDRGGAARVVMFLPPGTTPSAYYRYGPTPDNPSDHWYNFIFDGMTGAEFFPDRNQVVLHFVDGQRGDDDLLANGVIADAGGPASFVPRPSLTGPGDGVSRQTQAFTVSAKDPSAADLEAGFAYAIDWGDGSPLQSIARSPGNGAGVPVDHVFTRAGTFTITVTATDRSGIAGAPATATITVRAVPTPPVTVLGVQWQSQKRSRRKTVTVLVVSYSGALDPGHAHDLGDYLLVAAGKDKKFGTRDDRRMTLASATYDPASTRVTLTPRGKVPRQALRLSITGSGVLDAQGRPVDGNGDGQPGGDFTATVGRGNLGPALVRAASAWSSAVPPGAVDVLLENDLRARRQPR
jgi:hypothetical protein